MLKDADPEVPEQLHDRAADNWRPLLAIADAVGGDWPERARRAAIKLTGEGSDDADSYRTMLLADLRDLFAAEPSGVLFTGEILWRLHALEDRPWPEFRRDKEITAPQLAKLLKPLKISSNTVRRGSLTNKGYTMEQFADAWNRYLPPPAAVTTSKATDSAGFAHLEAVTPVLSVTARISPNTRDSNGCDVVTAPAGERGWRRDAVPLNRSQTPQERDVAVDEVPAFAEAEIE